MHQHLVHHHLEEQRRHQGEQLQHKGHQQHLAQQLAVLDHGRDEPGEVEFRQLTGQRGAGSEQNQLTGPARLQFRPRQHLRPLGGGVVDQHRIILDLRHDEEAAIHAQGHGWQWRCG
jgi:hypothetical protein